MDYIKKLFSGRINRRNFILGLISSITLFFVLIPLIFYPLLAYIYGNNIPTVFGTLANLLIIAVLLFNISLFVRRWHDLGSSGWSVLFNLVPLVNIFIILYVIFKGGKPEKNIYGDPPSERIKYPQDILALTVDENKDIKPVKQSRTKNALTPEELTTIEKLADLKKKGAITGDEFNKKKREILGL